MLASASFLSGHMNTLNPDQIPRRPVRRRHEPAFKARVVAACRQPGASLSAVALAHGLTANMVRKWVTEAGAGTSSEAGADQLPAAAAQPCSGILSTEVKAPAFVPLAISPGAPVAPITLELQRRGACIKVSWPIEAAEHCASMLRELQR